jgi:hypothetical protein
VDDFSSSRPATHRSLALIATGTVDTRGSVTRFQRAAVVSHPRLWPGAPPHAASITVLWLNRADAVFYVRAVSLEEQSMQKLALIAALALAGC